MSFELTDGTLFLRPFQANDAESLYDAVRESIDEISPWMAWCSVDYSLEDATIYIMSRDEAWRNDLEYGFAVFDCASGKFQASVGLNFVNRSYQMANLGYWVRTSGTGHGIASCATRLVARFAFEQLKLQRIEIVAAVDNIASQRVAEKAGARREGVLRKRLHHHGQQWDAVMFSLVAEDLESSNH